MQVTLVYYKFTSLLTFLNSNLMALLPVLFIFHYPIIQGSLLNSIKHNYQVQIQGYVCWNMDQVIKLFQWLKQLPLSWQCESPSTAYCIQPQSVVKHFRIHLRLPPAPTRINLPRYHAFFSYSANQLAAQVSSCIFLLK